MVETVVADGDVVSFLHNAGKRYKEHKELLRRKLMEEERKTCPFRPTVTEYAEDMSSRLVSRRSGAIEKRLHELHAKQLQVAEARRAESREKQEAELAIEMRPPHLTARARSYTSRDPVDVSRKWLEKREKKFTRLREESLRRDLETLRPIPYITPYARETASAARRQGQSVEEYLMARDEAKRERMYWMVEQNAGMHTSFTDSSSSCCGSERRQQFTPRITEYAKRLRRSGNVVDRLLSEGVNGARTQHDESCTFAPRVTPASVEMSKNYYRDPHALVHERLYHNKASGCRKTYKKNSSNLSDKELTGVPRICETSRLIVERKRSEEGALLHIQSPASRLHSTTGSVTTHAKHKCNSSGTREQHRGKGGEEEEGECTFQPHVNAASERMWKRQLQLLREDGCAQTAAGARELLWRRSQKRIEEEVRYWRELQAAEEMTECTFHPKVGRSPERRVHSKLSVLERNKRWQMQRERRLSDARRELEKTQLTECSFHPSVDPVFPLPVQSATSVSGYEAHIQRQEESRRRKREADVWWRPKASTIKHNTGCNMVSSPCHDDHRHRRKESQQEQRYNYQSGKRRQKGRNPSLESSRWSHDDSLSEAGGTQFVVHQPPMHINSTSSLSSSSLHQYSGGGMMTKGMKFNPVDFILDRHHAIVESARWQRQRQ